jgi:hypothetical protein
MVRTCACRMHVPCAFAIMASWVSHSIYILHRTVSEFSTCSRSSADERRVGRPPASVFRERESRVRWGPKAIQRQSSAVSRSHVSLIRGAPLLHTYLALASHACRDRKKVCVRESRRPDGAVEDSA